MGSDGTLITIVGTLGGFVRVTWMCRLFLPSSATVAILNLLPHIRLVTWCGSSMFGREACVTWLLLVS